MELAVKLAGVQKGEKVFCADVIFGATVKNNTDICSECTVGAVVVKNIKEPGTYIGVPIRKK